MREPIKSARFGRRRFLTGAGMAASVAAFSTVSAWAQQPEASPTPTPIRIQTPDLAFTGGLQALLGNWSASTNVQDVILSIVPAEPASDQLLTDARSGARRFSGALVPNWLLPDLVRDRFVQPAPGPSVALPPALAQLRSFGGQWFATDLDQDCVLLFYRADLLDAAKIDPPSTWKVLLEQMILLKDRSIGGIGLPVNHRQQVVDHFTAMAASHVLDSEGKQAFWFDEATMSPAIASDAHVRALQRWHDLGQYAPDGLRNGSTGDLWQAFIDGSVAYLVARADFFPYAIDRGIDPAVLGAVPLPGEEQASGAVVFAGNVSGASWGGVTMSSAGDRPASEVTAVLTDFASPESQERLWSDPSTGITPAPTSANDAERIAAFLVANGWTSTATAQWADAIFTTFSAPVWLPALRIAETRRYLQALEDRIVPFLVSREGSAGDALNSAAGAWDEINDAIGVDTQRDLYARSLMPPPSE